MPDPPARNMHRPLAALAAVGLALLAYRGYGPRFDARPTEHFPASAPVVELNAADRAELLQLPGVGPTLADAILSHRDAVGRFDRVDDLAAVKGIGPKTLDKLRPWLRVDPLARGQADDPPVERLVRKPIAPPPAAAGGKKLEPGQTVDVNTATAEELQRLPGVGPVMAGRIIAERAKKPFAAADDLRRVSGVGAKTLEKLRPFLSFPKPAGS